MLFSYLAQEVDALSVIAFVAWYIEGDIAFGVYNTKSDITCLVYDNC